jgi:hypothetical protein
MPAIAFIEVIFFGYVILWAVSVIYEHFWAERHEIYRGRLLRLQKMCGRMHVKHHVKIKTKVYFEKKFPKEHYQEPISPNLKSKGPRAEQFETWKHRYYMKVDDR